MESHLDADVEKGTLRGDDSDWDKECNMADELTMDKDKHLNVTCKSIQSRGLSSSATSITLNEQMDHYQQPIPDLASEKRNIERADQHAKRQKNGIGYYLRHKFTIYRRIFAVVFSINVAVLIWILNSTSGRPTSTAAGSAAAVNLAFSVMIRQEQVVNAIFRVCTSVPRSWPFVIRRHAAHVFHYGGFHSGCGVAAAAWYLPYTALVTQEYIRKPSNERLEALISAWILVLMFVLLLGGAHPTFRARFHNNFEVFHRFAGWTVLGTFWAHVLFTANRIAAETSTTMGMALVQSVSFWCIIVATIPVVTSWAQLRKHSVRAEKLSDHATRLHFNYRMLETCQVVRYSSNPLLEWHSFATIPDASPDRGAEGSEKTSPAKLGYSVVVSNAGDWTQKVIQRAPSHLWTRGSPYSGVTYTARLFNKVVIVATGSGIGPCLSLFVCSKTSSPRVFWSAPNPLETFGQGIISSLKMADPDAVIWDTKVKGRPDLINECVKLVEESGAEAVVCISNPKVCKLLVTGLEDRGIAAYAPIFDS